MVDSQFFNLTLRATLYGSLATAICILPMLIVGYALKRKADALAEMVKQDASLGDPELVQLKIEDAFAEWKGKHAWFRLLELFAIICVYPALIVNAMTRRDALGWLIIIPSCLVCYSAIAFFFVR